MAERTVPLERLARKGLRVSLRIPDQAIWQKRLVADPQIPRSYVQLKRLWKTMRSGRRVPSARLFPRRVGAGRLVPRFEACGERLYHRFYEGLTNPALSDHDRARIEADMLADTPEFENQIETDHFILKWTNASKDVENNIADSSLVSEAGDLLETAWARYNTAFGKAPYVPAGGTKIEVVFQDIWALGLASPPDGPIQLDAPNWISQPGIRQSATAHELFHKLQYAFGFRTVWTPTEEQYQWFSEGTAAWAEVYTWQRVAGATVITDLFDLPDMDLYSLAYSTLPFWIFFDTRQRDTPEDLPMVGYLQKYEASGDERASLAQAIDEDWPTNNVYGQLDHFFALFSRERYLGTWRQTPVGAQPYAHILGPDGVEITRPLAVKDVPLESGDSFTAPASVSGFGSDYFRFLFQPDTQGKTLTVTVTGAPGGDYSYYLIWEKDGGFKHASFPFFATGNWSFSNAIDLVNANALVLIISGRGAGGAYTMSATIT